MKLNADILFYHLKRTFNVEFSNRNKSAPFVGPPRFYENANDRLQNVMIVESEKLATFPHNISNTILLCIGELSEGSPHFSCDFMIIHSKTSKERVFNEVQSIFDLLNEWDKTLNEICYNETGFSALIECCNMILDSPISLLDNEFTYVAYSKELSKRRGLTQKFVVNNKLPLDSVTEIIAEPIYHVLEQNKDVFEFTAGESILGKNIFDADQKYVGRLTIISPKDVEYVTAIFNHLAAYIEKLYHRLGSFNIENTPSNIWHQLLTDCLNQHYISKDTIHKVVLDSNWTLQDEYQLIKILPNHRYDKTLHSHYLCPQLEHLWPGSCSVSFDSSIVLLINMNVYNKIKNQDFYQKLAYFLRENLLSASISRSFKDLNQIYYAYCQTTIAMEIGSKKNPMFWYYNFDDYAFDYLLQKLGGDFAPKQICYHGLLTLKEHDEETGTQYYHTLLTYCMMQYNSTAASKALFIHRSTFLGRMERIKELAQIDFTNWQEMLYILISFQLLEGI